MLAACNGDNDQSATVFDISTLSSRPDMVTGGDALVQIKYPEGVNPADVRVTLNGTDVTANFATLDTRARTIRGLRTG